MRPEDRKRSCARTSIASTALMWEEQVRGRECITWLIFVSTTCTCWAVAGLQQPASFCSSLRRSLHEGWHHHKGM